MAHFQLHQSKPNLNLIIPFYYDDQYVMLMYHDEYDYSIHILEYQGCLSQHTEHASALSMFEN